MNILLECVHKCINSRIFRIIDLYFSFGVFNVSSTIYTILLSDRNKILNNEQIDNGITLKSKPIMQKTLKNEMDNNA